MRHVIGRPRIEPELSISSDTPVSRKLVSFSFEGERVHRVGDDAGKARRIDHALVEVELPGAILLAPAGGRCRRWELADDALQVESCWSRWLRRRPSFSGVA